VAKFSYFYPLHFAEVKIFENYRLTSLNSFGVEAKCRYFAEVTQNDELLGLLEKFPPHILPHLLLGGGSNILFTSDYDGLVIKIVLRGIRVRRKTVDEVWLEVSAGEDWDELVKFCVENNWGGLENLSGIPGSVGSAPIQNIGAYGAELKDSFDSLSALDKDTGNIVTLTKEQCKFGYRDSIFKREFKNRYAILGVMLKLTVRNHVLNMTYGAIGQNMQEMGVQSPGIMDVRKAVLSIRQSKLPDPKVIGNAGSFFKNPVVSMEHFQNFIERNPGASWYPDGDRYKIAAGWLIEQAGWKGYREKDAGVHSKQALVLVNYGNATGNEILQLSHKVIASVYEKYNILLEAEVNII